MIICFEIFRIGTGKFLFDEIEVFNHIHRKIRRVSQRGYVIASRVKIRETDDEIAFAEIEQIIREPIGEFEQLMLEIEYRAIRIGIPIFNAGIAPGR